MFNKTNLLCFFVFLASVANMYGMKLGEEWDTPSFKIDDAREITFFKYLPGCEETEISTLCCEMLKQPLTWGVFPFRNDCVDQTQRASLFHDCCEYNVRRVKTRLENQGRDPEPSNNVNRIKSYLQKPAYFQAITALVDEPRVETYKKYLNDQDAKLTQIVNHFQFPNITECSQETEEGKQQLGCVAFYETLRDFKNVPTQMLEDCRLYSKRSSWLNWSANATLIFTASAAACKAASAWFSNESARYLTSPLFTLGLGSFAAYFGVRQLYHPEFKKYEKNAFVKSPLTKIGLVTAAAGLSSVAAYKSDDIAQKLGSLRGLAAEGLGLFKRN